MGRQDGESETLIPVRTHGGVFDVAHTLKADGFDASEDGTGRGVPLVPICFDTTQITSPGNYSRPSVDGPCHPLAAGQPAPTIAFAIQERGVPVIPIDMRQASRGEKITNKRSQGSGGAPGDGIGDIGDPAFTVSERGQAVAYDLRGREGGAQFEGPHDTANLRAADGGSSRSYVADQWAVRRLTPMECERLQGFPDGWTDIPRANGKPAADGPRYRALGNSMAVNVMRWIGMRIALADEVFADIGGAAP